MLRRWEEVDFPGSSENSGMEEMQTQWTHNHCQKDGADREHGGVDVLNLSSRPQSAVWSQLKHWSISTET